MGPGIAAPEPSPPPASISSPAADAGSSPIGAPTHPEPHLPPFMETMTRMMTPAALVALALLSAAPALAQPTRQPATPSSSSRPGFQESPTSVYNSELLDEAMHEFGINPSRLRPKQIERIEEIRRLLFPSLNPRLHRLNRTQAIAVVYTALVYPRGTGGGRGGWDDGNGYDDDRDRDRPPYDRPRGGNRQCVEVDKGVYELLNLMGGEGQTMFLDDTEMDKVRTTATVVQREAISRGFRQVADRAADVIGALRSFSPSRRVVADRVIALKAAADQACGGDDR